jgi:N-acetylmuramoyl-L-alanine amidase
MGVLRKRWSGGVCGVAIAAALAGVCGASTRAKKVDPWTAAVRARAAFEAEPRGTHTRAEYARVMDGFRAIYHDDPSDVHAARAVEQVAELLEEQGTELHDRKAMSDAVGQLDFLKRAYPGYRAEPLGETRVQGSGSRVQKTVQAPEGSAVVLPTSQDRDVGHPSGSDAVVTGIRHWSTATYTRLAIDLTGDDGDEVKYEAARVEHPDRIFFDLHHAKLAPQLEGKSFAVTDGGFLTRIRAAQAGGDVTRVVLDVPEVAEYSAFLLPNPERLIIDIHGRAVNSEQLTANSGAPAPIVRVPARAGAQVTAEVSSLPPMQVTNGSAEIGLRPTAHPSQVQGRAPSTGSGQAPSTGSGQVVGHPAQPRAAHPVPDTVGSESSANGTEVAAVSEQPGKVAATRRPTSQPVTSGTGSREQGIGNREGQNGDHYIPRSQRGVEGNGITVASSPVASLPVKGAPAAGAPPTAEGETSLMRALGLKIGRIVIDAGHGGHDSGTLGAGGIQEKDVVLDVALRLGRLLHDRLGAEIVYTRDDDTFIPLETRTAIANKAQADLFISVHANSSPDESARGVEVYYLNFTSDPDAMRVAARENAVSTESVHELSDLVKKIALKDKIDESKELASDVDASLYAGLERGNPGLKDRGVKKAPFVVLIGANMPSILAEISFVTNPDDAAQLETEAYRERVAESLFRGVAKYAAGINGAPAARPVTERAAR